MKKLQISCIKWMNENYPQYQKHLYTMVSGSWVIMARGVNQKYSNKPFFLAKPKKVITEDGVQYIHGMFIEIVGENDVRGIKQKEFQLSVELVGYRYATCRSVNEFMREITEYLK